MEIKTVFYINLGDESLAAELRVRTVIEMAAFADWYMQQYKNDNFDEHCGVSYDKTIYECSVDGGHASAWALCGLASVIQRPINTVYPCKVNGENDVMDKLLNRTLQPRLAYVTSVDSISIMWTRASYHDPTRMWVSNHFVPLIQVQLCPMPPAASPGVSTLSPTAASSPADPPSDSNEHDIDIS